MLAGAVIARLHLGRLALAGQAEQVLGDERPLRQAAPVGAEQGRHPRPRAHLRRVAEPLDQPGLGHTTAEVSQRRPRRRVRDTGEGGLVTASAAQSADRLTAALRQLLLLGRLRQFLRDVLQARGGERLAREPLALPPDLDARRHAGQRPVADADAVQPRVARERLRRLDPRRFRPPGPVEDVHAVDGDGHLAADVRPQADGAGLAQDQDAGPRHLERAGRQARVRAEVAPGEGRLGVEVDEGGLDALHQRAVLRKKAGAQLSLLVERPRLFRVPPRAGGCGQGSQRGDRRGEAYQSSHRPAPVAASFRTCRFRPFTSR